MPDVEQLVSALSTRQPGLWLLRPDDRVAALAPIRYRPPRVPHVRVLRPDDLVVLDIALHGLAVEELVAGEPAAGRVLRRENLHATLAVHFPPQALAEEAIFDSSTTDQPTPLPPGSLPVQSRNSGPTRLAFRMPSGTDVLDFTSAALLRAMATWPLARAPIQLIGPVTVDVAGRLREISDAVAALLPEGVKTQATAVVDRSAQRAVASVSPGDLSAAALTLAAESLADETAAAAAGLGLQDVHAAAFALYAEVTFGARLVARERARDGVSAVFDGLPGLALLGTPREPAVDVTAIELPYRLVQSPADADATFSHALDVVTRDGRTELWHTRLGRRTVAGEVVDATDGESELAAIWSPDYGAPDEDVPGFTTSLTALERDQIVRLTADQSGWTLGRPPRRYAPVPLRAHRLMLTALGGWLDLEGVWDAPRPAGHDGAVVDLASWKHHAALGRDWFVETVHVGRVMPFGHRAVTITITERRFQDEPDGAGRVGILRQQLFVEIREPLRTYPDPRQPFGGRDFPSRTVEILTHRTPALALPPGGATDSFWPRVSGPSGEHDFRFEVRATDIGGAVSRFDVPLRFVADRADVAPAVAAYNGPDQAVTGRTTAPLHGQPVQLAPAASRVTPSGDRDPGDVVYPVHELRFGVAAPTFVPPKDGSLPRFHPRIATASVMSTALAQLIGNDQPVTMAFASTYQKSGFDPTVNKAELLLVSAAATPLQVDFATRSNSDKAGGIVTPNFGVSGTSRSFGLVGGDTDILAGGTFNPANFFPHAKIFGGVDLADLLAPVAVALLGATVPTLTTKKTAEKIETTFEYHVGRLKNVPLIRVNERGTSSLDIKAVMTAFFQVADPVERDADGKAVSTIGTGPGAVGGNPPGLKDPVASAEAKLTFFKLNIFDCIIVTFDWFTFKVTTGSGVDADPKIADTDGVVFSGPLAFVDDLRKSLGGTKKSGGGGGGGGAAGGGGSSIPGFEVTPIFKPEPSGLTVGVKLGVTKLPMGIFVLKNLMVSTAVKLPFDGKPLSVQFGFAERAHPFQLVVSLLGGGGFVVIGLDTEHGVTELEAALEFGAFAELDIGVASGAVYVKAGIYIYWNQPEKLTTLKGYVEVGGEVQVLGILSVSILMHLSLGYYKVGSVSEVRGQATLVVEVEFLFFSASVNLTVERCFGGTESDPTFADLIPQQQLWDQYADAFA